ncbi:nucleoside hydrolase 3-like [Andrographis paniculata]|uniref:nucleoside hydrolase 3-like n=1 Tax=Andrographis paniculata TaxID=175694 RepID=UPI0021E70FBF|nr:nucleoside hydrolase 3-like [Andrographis paniculata]
MGFLSICILYIVMVIGLVAVEGKPQRILLDTDVDTDDIFALLYILKLNRSEIHLQAVTINANSWSDAGHAVNHVYDILYMMGRDDVAVGVGGEGGILDGGEISPDVGGYQPIIDQGNGTAGYCRYRQAIPAGHGGRLDIDTNFGFRRSFLPQGRRRYSPLHQPTAQRVMTDAISAAPITVLTIGTATNLGIFMMSNPHLKKNIKHVYIMGGGVRSKNPTDCGRKNSRQPRQCRDRGNIFTDFTSNPYAEFNMFGDPFAAYQVIHSGIPATLVPLDATNTIPLTAEFFEEFERNQHTFEAQYCFKSLKIARDSWFDDQFFTSYFMWDSFLSGVATSAMLKLNPNSNGENDFAEMEYMNITVITSNKPYGISDGSNPFFDGRTKPKFNLKRNGVHSGHVQTRLRDPFCISESGNGRCKDGCTSEVAGREGVRALVAVRAKPNRHDEKFKLNKEFLRSFLDVINRPRHAGKFNFTTQFPHYREVHYKPDYKGRNLGKTVVFDMDMSAGDFLALFYLLKTPVEVINLKAILVTPTGWANAATIDVIYDLLHMMGRDDIPVGLGDMFALNQSDPIFSAVGDCKYSKAIPHGSSGFLDSDTLFGLARDLPRSPRRYTAENSVRFGALRDTDRPDLRQPLAVEVWEHLIESIEPGSKITILANGPLTNVAKILLSSKESSFRIQEIFVVGGLIRSHKNDKGNVFNVPSNRYAELNMFLDPLAAKIVFESRLGITLIPLNVQRKVGEFVEVLECLSLTKKTPEATFTTHLLSRLQRLKSTHHRYHRMDMFLGEILGAVILAGDNTILKTTYKERRVEILATGEESEDGVIKEHDKGSFVKVLENVDTLAYYKAFADRLGEDKQSAVVGSFNDQKRLWRRSRTCSE